MIINIYAIRDLQVEAFLQPFFSPTTGAAIRSVTEAANDANSNFSKYAADYSLYILGCFDDATGVIVPGEPHRIVSLMELLKTNP